MSLDILRRLYVTTFQPNQLSMNQKVYSDSQKAEFKDINLSVNNDSGAVVSMIVNRNGTKVVRLLLIRQHVRDAGTEDYRNLLLGFKYGGVPSVNSLHSLYNFQDKPWVFSQLLHMQRRLGKENFPLIEQSYFPNHKEMVSLHSKVFDFGTL
ncbi:synapsin [Caerostris extrusa]|uniref:Synapsin n=1 Tax=Caerostris extrusa TaxID=172846 RepID=A0AAV4Y8Y7_CAEEX|nr:synapsin [Caerostris extrusa]